MKKVFTNAELKELMDVAKTPLRVPIRKKQLGADRHSPAHSVEQIRKFSEGENLNGGITKLPIPVELIYNRYALWCKNNYEVATSYLIFFKKFRLFFNMKKIGGETHYLVNPEGFDTSEQNKQFVSHELKKKIKSKNPKPRS